MTDHKETFLKAIKLSVHEKEQASNVKLTEKRGEEKRSEQSGTEQNKRFSINLFFKKAWDRKGIVWS